MGGIGSSRWQSHRKKRTVEESLCLNINDMAKRGIVRDRIRWNGIWDLTNGDGTRADVTVSYEVNTLDDEPGSVRLTYRFSHIQHDFDYSISLDRTVQPLGGERWWFRCPMWLTDGPCGQRKSKLYLPRGDQYFGCRSCHKLTYRSSQTYDKRVKELATLGEELEIILAHMNEPGWLEQNLGKVSLALKAK